MGNPADRVKPLGQLHTGTVVWVMGHVRVRGLFGGSGCLKSCMVIILCFWALLNLPSRWHVDFLGQMWHLLSRDSQELKHNNVVLIDIQQDYWPAILTGHCVMCVINCAYRFQKCDYLWTEFTCNSTQSIYSNKGITFEN